MVLLLQIASRLTASEQELLRNALKTVAQQKGSVSEITNFPNLSHSLFQHSPLSSAQTRQLFVVNTLPFIGFGMLDNMIMIVAGEYIDQVTHFKKDHSIFLVSNKFH